MNRTPISEAYNMDCMDFMRGCKDKEFDLAVVDPPYGINISDRDTHAMMAKTKKPITIHKAKKWDSEIPSSHFFAEIQRVSKRQIIWGGNFFTQYLQPSRHWILWDKNQPFDAPFYMAEMAWCSFGRGIRVFYKSSASNTNTVSNNRAIAMANARIHPTQKPVALYRWIFQNYASPGQRILDTHLGSGSSRIAAYDMGLDFYATELDPDYFAAMEARFKAHIAKPQLFTPEQQYTFKQAELFGTETLEK